MKKVLPFFVSFVFLLLSTLFFLQEFNRDIKDLKLFSISLIIFTGMLGFFIGLLVKKFGFLQFSSTIFPALASIIGTIWLLSSGYLNLRAENLKSEITDFKKEKDSIILIYKESKFKNDSLNVVNDSIIELNKIIQEQFQKTTTELQRENAVLFKKNEEFQKIYNYYGRDELIAVIIPVADNPTSKESNISMINRNSWNKNNPGLTENSFKITFYDDNFNLIECSQVSLVSSNKFAVWGGFTNFWIIPHNKNIKQNTLIDFKVELKEYYNENHKKTEFSIPFHALTNFKVILTHGNMYSTINK